jgi:hypothetical protein
MVRNSIVRSSIFLMSLFALSFAFSPVCTCGDLPVPNSVCSMASDLSVAGTCFNVLAPNVTINCNGYSIIGTSEDSDFRGIYSNQPGTSVNDCSISGFPYGIYLADGADDAAISGTNASTSNGIGIRISGVSNATISNVRTTAHLSYALWLQNSNHSALENITAISNDSAIWVDYSSYNSFANVNADGPELGIYMQNDSFSTISNSNASSRDWAALEMQGCNNITITGFRGTSVDGEGIAIESESSSITLTNTSGTSSTAAGIFIGGANDLTISNVTASSTSGDGLQEYGGMGNTISDSVLTSVSGDGFDGTSNCQVTPTITISDSTLTSASGNGFHEKTGCRDIVFGNTISSTSGNAISISATAYGNTFYWNNLSSTSGAYVNDLNGGNFYNATTPSGSNEGNIYANVIDGTISVQGNVTSSGFPSLYIGMNGTGQPYSNANSGGKINGSAVDNAPLTPFYYIVSGPVISPHANETHEATSSAGAEVNYTGPTANDDPDGSVPVFCTPASGSVFPLGENTVTCNANDSEGNTATSAFTITVVDTTPPAIGAHDNVTVEATSSLGAIVSFTTNATDLVDGPVSPACLPASGSTFALGITVVNCTATDSRNNTNETSLFAVTVQDTTPPALEVPLTITEEATSSSGAAVNFSANATDMVDGAITPICSPASGSIFALGSTTVICNANDSSGNAAYANFTVFVQDTAPPAISEHENLAAEATSSFGANVSYELPNATDAVDGPVNVTCTPASGTLFALGETNVTCGASDSAGNIASSIFTITVVDTTAPLVVLITPANASTAAGASQAFAWNATDAVSQNVSCSLYVDGALSSANITVARNVSGTQALSSLAYGAHNWTVGCTDDANLTGMSGVGIFTLTEPSAPPSNPGGNNGGGSGGSGGGSSSSTEASVTMPVGICANTVCDIRVARSIESSNTSSVMTTTIENMGGSACNINDFVYSDTVPDNFASVDELSFSTAYSSRSGQNVKFTFSTFAPGESKTLTYTAPRWVAPSRLKSFSSPALSAKQCVILPVVNATPNATANETKPPVIARNATPAANASRLEVRSPSNQSAVEPPLAASLFGLDLSSLGQYEWAICPIAILAALLLLAIFMRKKCKNSACKAMNWPWAKKCGKCGHAC